MKFSSLSSLSLTIALLVDCAQVIEDLLMVGSVKAMYYDPSFKPRWPSYGMPTSSRAIESPAHEDSGGMEEVDGGEDEGESQEEMLSTEANEEKLEVRLNL